MSRRLFLLRLTPIGAAPGYVVRKERLELSWVTPLEPKSSASTSFATFALF
jgi:hypothetical protein